jgi:ribosome-binding factor A
MPSMSSRRQQQMNSFLRQEISVILELETGDPRLQRVTVTTVEVSPSFQDARVYVSLPQYDNPDDSRSTLQALTHAAGRIRKLLAARMRSRYTPRLVFYEDETLSRADRLEQLFERLHEEEGDSHGQ